MKWEFFKFSLDRQLANEIIRKTRLERAVLRSRAKKSPHRHCAMSLHLQSPASNAIRDILEKEGISDLASAYMGKPMEFMSASLEYAHRRPSKVVQRAVMGIGIHPPAKLSICISTLTAACSQGDDVFEGRDAAGRSVQLCARKSSLEPIGFCDCSAQRHGPGAGRDVRNGAGWPGL